MPRVYEYCHTVNHEEIDALGHVNNLAYLRWMQDAAVAHSEAQGWPTSRYLEFGAGWVVRSHAIEYFCPAFCGEQILVRTWVANFKKATSLRRYTIVRPADQSLLAEAHTNWAFIGIERQVPRRIPAEISAAFELVSDSEQGRK
jgi:acyl-CoA thioester hydrolase